MTNSKPATIRMIRLVSISGPFPRSIHGAARNIGPAAKPTVQAPPCFHLRRAGGTPNHPHYLTRVRRRWIKIARTITNITPATIRIIKLLSIRLSSFHQWLFNWLNDSIIKITAGPRVTINSAGKMKNTSGKTSFTEVFAACSSTACIRCVLKVSA